MTFDATTRAKRPNALITFVWLLGMMASAHAQTPIDRPAGAPTSVRDSYFVCVDKNSVRTAIAQCQSDERSFQDQRLNQAYKTLGSLVSASQKQKLQAAQRAWLDFIKKEQRFDGDIRQAFEDELSVSEHQIFLIAQRSDSLEKHIRFVKP